MRFLNYVWLFFKIIPYNTLLCIKGLKSYRFRRTYCLILAFFKEEIKDRQFFTVNEKMDMTEEKRTVLEKHTIYARGNAYILEENLKNHTGKDKIKVSVTTTVFIISQ